MKRKMTIKKKKKKKKKKKVVVLKKNMMMIQEWLKKWLVMKMLRKCLLGPEEE